MFFLPDSPNFKIDNVVDSEFEMALSLAVRLNSSPARSVPNLPTASKAVIPEPCPICPSVAGECSLWSWSDAFTVTIASVNGGSFRNAFLL